MKRAIAFTLAVALIGGLAFMAAAGTAAAQEDIEFDDLEVDAEIEDTLSPEADATTGDQNVTQDLETGDATNEVQLDQSNENAQLGAAESGDALAVSDGGADAAAPAAAPADKKAGAPAPAAAPAGTGGDAIATSAASVDQAQDVDQTNEANIDQTADTSIDADLNATQEQDPVAEAGLVDDLEIEDPNAD